MPPVHGGLKHSYEPDILEDSQCFGTQILLQLPKLNHLLLVHVLIQPLSPRSPDDLIEIEA